MNWWVYGLTLLLSLAIVWAYARVKRGRPDTDVESSALDAYWVTALVILVVVVIPVMFGLYYDEIVNGLDCCPGDYEMVDDELVDSR